MTNSTPLGSGLCKLLAVALVVVGAGCSAVPCPEVATVPDDSGYETDWNRFLVAYGELDQAIFATPEWENPEESSAEVEGFGRLVVRRLDALRPYAPHGCISEPAVDLAQRHVEETTRLIPVKLEDDAYPEYLDPDERMTYYADEVAFRKMECDLYPLERYVEAGIPNPWLADVVLPDYREAAARVPQITQRSRCHWSTVDPVTEARYEEIRDRCAAVLAGLDALDRRAMPDSEPVPAPHAAPGPDEMPPAETRTPTKPDPNEIIE